MLFKKGLFVIAVLLLTLSVGAKTAAAQNWCYDWCYGYTSCDEACWNGGWTTCGDWGTCDWHRCSDSAICNTNVECASSCYEGEWPNGYWTTCGDAGRPCTTCTANYQYSWTNVGQWNQVSYPYLPLDPSPVCQGFKTEQYIGTDSNHCIWYPYHTYGDCRVAAITSPRYGDNNCCDNMSGGCWGEVWPSSCTN
jgi:hypothetical protein